MVKVQTVKVAELLPHPDNPRRRESVAVLEDSLQSHGQYKPLVVNRQTKANGFSGKAIGQMVVLAGNHTLKAMAGLEWGEASAVVLEVDAAKAHQIMLMDNRSSDDSDYDPAALLAALQSVTSLDGTGFTDNDVDDLMAQLQEPTGPWKDNWKHDPADDLRGQLESYESHFVRNIVLTYVGDEYQAIVSALDAYREQHSLESNSDAIAKLLGVT